jgi:exodeoxyribonuclease VII small subunit
MAKSASKSKTEGRPEETPSFETSLARLEEIVERLDDGNLPLEESLALFKEGTKLARICRNLLAEAEVQVKEALRDVEAEPDDEGDDDLEEP